MRSFGSKLLFQLARMLFLHFSTPNACHVTYYYAMTRSDARHRIVFAVATITVAVPRFRL